MKKASLVAFKIAVIYAVISIFWILLSDHLLNYFIADPMLIIEFEIAKGWFFVGITAILLYNLIFKHMEIIIQSEKKLQVTHEETMSAYEELIAQEEELKQQFDEILNREEQIRQSNESLYHLHETLKMSEQRNEALIDALPDCIFQLDGQGTLLNYKEGKDLAWTMDIQTRIGSKIESFLSPEYSLLFMEKIKESLLSEVTQIFECQHLDQGIMKYQEVRMVKSGINEVIAITREITTRKVMECKLQYYALHDKVTGLYNRSYFEDKIQKLTESKQVPIGVVMCDIDGLKLVNDTFGHQAGDELLMSAVSIIESCLSGMDEVARVGGDEFAILLPNKNKVEVEELCHRIREKVLQFRKDHIKIPMSISLGSAIRTKAEESMVEIFKVADDNMYREKLHSSQSIRSSIVQTLGKALEERDFVTSGHADRLQHLTVELAMAIGLTDSRLSDLRLFGRFHDIGKVGIPDEILFKPGRLNEREFEIMKRHCEIGYRIAQSSGDLAPIADWILKHQEWWNGQGYPLGIKGDSIPLPCRILSIVDAYDAMTNDRPYRNALCHEEAIVEIERCVGTQFDPDLVQIFKGVVVKTLELAKHEEEILRGAIPNTSH